jgi:hypothetical protein
LLHLHNAEPQPHPEAPVHALSEHPHDGVYVLLAGSALLPAVPAALAVLEPNANSEADTTRAQAIASIVLFIYITDNAMIETAYNQLYETSYSPFHFGNFHLKRS